MLTSYGTGINVAMTVIPRQRLLHHMQVAFGVLSGGELANRDKKGGDGEPFDPHEGFHDVDVHTPRTHLDHFLNRISQIRLDTKYWMPKTHLQEWLNSSCRGQRCIVKWRRS